MAQHCTVARPGSTGGKVFKKGKYDILGRQEPHPLLRRQKGRETICDGGGGRGIDFIGQKRGLMRGAFGIIKHETIQNAQHAFCIVGNKTMKNMQHAFCIALKM